MIKLSGSRFTDIMPENLAEQPEIQALAYAVGRQVEKLRAYADDLFQEEFGYLQEENGGL